MGLEIADPSLREISTVSRESSVPGMTTRNSSSPTRATAPVFSGLQFGASFQPHQGKTAGPVTGTASTNNVAGDGMNIITAGLNYKHSFGPVSLLAGIEHTSNGNTTLLNLFWAYR